MKPEPTADSRYAIYLIPPYPVAQRVVQIHTVLRKQFGFIAADQFQVHATIKGFFKKNDSPLEALVRRLDAVFADRQPFSVQFHGYHIDEGGIGLDISQRDGAANADLQRLRDDVVKAVLPSLSPDCDFATKDLAPPFKAHITLAFKDISPHLYDDILEYLADAPLPEGSFVARTFHLLEFFSHDWSSNWEQTLTWRLLKTWRLANPNTILTKSDDDAKTSSKEVTALT